MVFSKSLKLIYSILGTLKCHKWTLEWQRVKLKIPPRSWLFAVHARPRTPYAPPFLPVTLLRLTHHLPQHLSHQPRATHKPDLSRQLSRDSPRNDVFPTLLPSPQTPFPRWLLSPTTRGGDEQREEDAGPRVLWAHEAVGCLLAAAAVTRTTTAAMMRRTCEVKKKSSSSWTKPFPTLPPL